MDTMTAVIPEIRTATREDHPDKASWLQARTRGLGGSDAAVILGRSPYKSPLALYSEKIGLVEPPDTQSEAAEWGVLLETKVAEKYAKVSGLPLYYPGPWTIYRSKTNPFLSASFDRLILNQNEEVGAVLQVKTTGAWHEEEWEADVPLHVTLQVHHEMLVAGVQHAAVAVLIGGQKYRSYDVAMNQDLAEVMMREEAAFWQRILNRDPPEPDGTKSSREILGKLYPKHVEGKTISLPAEAMEWDRLLGEANAKLDKWKGEKDLYESKIKAALGDAERGMMASGVGYSWKASPRAGYEVKPTVVRTLRRVSPKR
jgi:putative phage-type endonuclease